MRPRRPALAIALGSVGGAEERRERGETLSGSSLQDHVRPVDRDSTHLGTRSQRIVEVPRPQQVVC